MLSCWSWFPLCKRSLARHSLLPCVCAGRQRIARRVRGNAKHPTWTRRGSQPGARDQLAGHQARPAGPLPPTLSSRRIPNQPRRSPRSAPTQSAPQPRAETACRLLVFSVPGCGHCDALLPQVAGWQQQHRDRLTVALASRRSAGQKAATPETHGLRDVLLQANREIAEAYQAKGTPSAVLIGADGKIASPLAWGARRNRLPPHLRHLHRLVLPVHPLRGVGGRLHHRRAAAAAGPAQAGHGARRHAGPVVPGVRPWLTCSGSS